MRGLVWVWGVVFMWVWVMSWSGWGVAWPKTSQALVSAGIQMHIGHSSNAHRALTAKRPELGGDGVRRCCRSAQVHRLNVSCASYEDGVHS